MSVCLSVSPSVTNFDPNYLRTSKTEWAKKIDMLILTDNLIENSKLH